MTTPAAPHPSYLHQFHHGIDQFMGDIKKVVDDAKKNGGEVHEEDLNRLASDIQHLEENANQILRTGFDTDDELVIDAQILLGIITQHVQPTPLDDREITMLQAARDYVQRENGDLKELVKAFSENDEEKEILLSTIDRISYDILVRCHEAT